MHVRAAQPAGHAARATFVVSKAALCLVQPRHMQAGIAQLRWRTRCFLPGLGVDSMADAHLPPIVQEVPQVAKAARSASMAFLPEGQQLASGRRMFLQ